MSFETEHLDANRLLEQWRWLCTESVTLIARSGFGDLFLRTVEGKVLCLNVGDGTLAEVAESESSFKDSLKHSTKRELWFAEQQLEAFADHDGLKPNGLQCIGFKVPVVFAERNEGNPGNRGHADSAGDGPLVCRSSPATLCVVW